MAAESTAAGALAGRICLVTGASRGIGRAIAMRYAKEGADLVLTARTVGALEELDDAIRAINGKTSLLVPMDLRNFDTIDQLGAGLYERYGKVDVLVGNAGVLGQLWPAGIACCVINLPFMIWAVTASAAALDPDLELAAANCGAPPLQTFFSVTLPAVMPGVISGSLLMFILALNEFLVSLLLVDARIVTLPVQIYNSIRSIITPDLAAISVIFIASAVVAVAALDRLVGLEIFLKSK